MERQASPQAKSVGTAPGTLVIPDGAVPSDITVIRYAEDRHERFDHVLPADLAKLVATDSGVVWVDVSGSGTLAVYQTLIERFGLPWLTIGFVSIAGLAVIAPGSMLTAKLGARVAHALSRRRLAQAFGVFLVVVGSRMVYRALA